MSTADGLRVMLHELPLGNAVLAVAALAFLTGIATIWLGARRAGVVRDAAREPARVPSLTPWPELLGVFSALAVPVIAAASIAIARGSFDRSLQASDVAVKATGLAAAVSGQLTAGALAAPLAVLTLTLAAIGLALAITPRCRVRGLAIAAELEARGTTEEASAWREHPGPNAGQVLPATLCAAAGVGSLLFGLWGWSGELTTAFAAVAGVDPSQKARLLLAALDEARPILERGPLLGAALLSAGAICAVLQLVVFSAARRRRRIARTLPASPRLPTPAFLLGTGGCLAVAAACFVLAGPYRAENRDPLPVRLEAPSLELDDTIATAALAGPDPARRAPLLSVGSALEVDGAPFTSPTQLREQLEVKKHNVLLVNPDTTFPGEILLQADRTVQVHRLLPLLAAARGAGYPHATLVFGAVRRLDRPLLGRLTLRSTTGAALELVPAPGPASAARVQVRAGAPSTVTGSGELLLEVEGAARYAELAATVVAARRAGRRVLLSVAP